MAQPWVTVNCYCVLCGIELLSRLMAHISTQVTGSLKNLSGLLRAQASTPLNTFGMNWDNGCALDISVRLPALLFLNGHKSQQLRSEIWWKAFPKEEFIIVAKWKQLDINAYGFENGLSILHIYILYAYIGVWGQ